MPPCRIQGNLSFLLLKYNRLHFRLASVLNWLLSKKNTNFTKICILGVIAYNSYGFFHCSIILYSDSDWRIIRIESEDFHDIYLFLQYWHSLNINYLLGGIQTGRASQILTSEFCIFDEFNKATSSST